MGAHPHGQASKGLMPLEDAWAWLAAQAHPKPGVEGVHTFAADGHVLAQDVVAALNVPGFDNSAMDGYAIRVADVAQAVKAGQALPVSQRVAAGQIAQALQPATAARVFTGAPLPAGADAVVMQEHVSLQDVGEACPLGAIRLHDVPVSGQWIRRCGDDVQSGQVVLSAGCRLGPGQVGLAASLGLAALPVVPRLRVALFSTGDELVMPGEVPPESLPLGAIYNSNRFFLHAMLQRLGCEVSDMGIVPDARDATLHALQRAAADHDLILSSGGVSVGEEDHVKPAVQQLGGLDLWQIAMKPGKPFAYGWLPKNDVGGVCHFMGLPGNPVSSFVTFALLVRPFVRRLQGEALPVGGEIEAYTLPAHFAWPRPDQRREFLRVRRNANGGLDLFPHQGSAVLTSLAWADGLVDNPAGQSIEPGQMVRFIPLLPLLAG